MCNLKSIRRVAKRTRRTWLRSIKNRNKRKLISRIRVNRAYRIDGRDNVLVIAKGFGFSKVALEIIACNNETRWEGLGHMAYSETVKRLTPVSLEDLPLFISLDHSDLLNDLLLEA